MIYDLGPGYDVGQTDPWHLLTAIWAVASNGVTPPPVNPPVITSFTAVPATLPYGGGSVTLSWASTDALSVAISGLSGTFPASGSTTVSVAVSATFSATATGAGGTSAAKTASVTVAAAPPPPVTYDSAGTYQAGYSAGYGVGFPAGVSSVHKPDSTLGYSLGLAAGKLIGAASVVCPDSVKGYALGLAAGKLQGAAAVKLDSIHAQIYLSNGTIVKE